MLDFVSLLIYCNTCIVVNQAVSTAEDIVSSATEEPSDAQPPGAHVEAVTESKPNKENADSKTGTDQGRTKVY